VVSEEDHNAAEDNDEQKMCMVEVGHQDEGDDPDEVEADHQNKGDELHSRHQYGQEQNVERNLLIMRIVMLVL
jgi:hypothetical protein